MYEKYKTQAKIRVSSYNFTSVCVQESWTIRAHKWLISIKIGSLACSWCEHTVPESLGHVLVANQGGMEVVQLYIREEGGGRTWMSSCVSIVWNSTVIQPLAVDRTVANTSKCHFNLTWLTSERKSIVRSSAVVPERKGCTTTAKSLYCLAAYIRATYNRNGLSHPAWSSTYIVHGSLISMQLYTFVIRWLYCAFSASKSCLHINRNSHCYIYYRSLLIHSCV